MPLVSLITIPYAIGPVCWNYCQQRCSVAPHIVEGIYGNNEQGGLGDLIQSIDTTEMNKINISESDVSILQQRFLSSCHMVVVL